VGRRRAEEAEGEGEGEGEEEEGEEEEEAEEEEEVEEPQSGARLSEVPTCFPLCLLRDKDTVTILILQIQPLQREEARPGQTLHDQGWAAVAAMGGEDEVVARSKILVRFNIPCLKIVVIINLDKIIGDCNDRERIFFVRGVQG
jgi:hypothetical protein